MNKISANTKSKAPLKRPPLKKTLKNGVYNATAGVLRSAIDAVSNLIYPPHCTYCDEEILESDSNCMLCDGCVDDFYDADSPRCECCGRIVPALDSYIQGCVSCSNNQFHFQRVFALGNYDSALFDAVLKTKQPTGQYLAAALSQLLAHQFANTIKQLEIDVIVPICMHWKRRLQRGHNNAEVIAEQLSRRLKIPVVNNLLTRVQHTTPQSELTPRQRWENMRDAFKINSGYKLDQPKILLVDDILTTGATCHQAAWTLKQAGAAEVYVAVIARATGEHTRK